MTKISIIILTKNAGTSFRETLSAIYNQKEVPSFEVIIIDSGSNDGFLEICSQFPVRLVQIPPVEFGHGRTRNFGSSLAAGEFLVFLVQDALPLDAYWLRNLLEPLLTDNRVAGAYSRNIPRPGASRRQAREIERYFLLTERLQTSPADHIFSDVSSVIRKAVLDRIPFPPVAFGEDQLWAKTVLAGGYLIKYEPSSVVVHSHDYDLAKGFHRGLQEGVLAQTMAEGRRPASLLVIIFEALYETVKWAVRGDLKSCRYSLAMVAWHCGYRKGYSNRCRVNGEG
jgi:glycosyltransferase involved in cell wall biosynthesis